MQSFSKQQLYCLRADANALGGRVEKPVEKMIPTLAPVSLPPAGGFATARSEAFTSDEIVSFSSAYTRVSGREHATDGSSSILVAAVVEDLNILEVVRAERVAMQIAISLPAEPGPIGISIAGSAFEGLRLAGQECHLKLNPDLQRPDHINRLFTWDDARRIEREQATALLNGLEDQEGDLHQWALRRRERLAGDAQPWAAGQARCSLVDSLEVSGASRCFGHVVEIPEFGRIILGELLISPGSVQLVGIRADLGCPVQGRISSNAVGGGGTPDD